MQRNKFTIFIVVIVLLVALSTSGVTYALYVGTEQSDHLITPPAFNFTADFLETNQTTNSAYDDFVITLYNYDKDNTAQGSSANITYNTQIVYYNSSDVQIGSTVSTTGNILEIGADGIGNDTATLSVTYNSSASYAVVTVATTAPYTKTVSGRFNFSVATASTYSFVDNGGYCTLTIKTGSQSQTLVLSWSTALYAPDDTNPLITGYTTSDTTQSKTISFSANSAYTFVFFENTAISHSTSSGTLTSSLTLPNN